ncbi:MAG TPA: serine/threonine-protein kinase, partial [Allocoleopsis sp.]
MSQQNTILSTEEPTNMFHINEIILNRYEIKEQLSSEGNFSLIFVVIDYQQNNTEKILKVLNLTNYITQNIKIIELFKREYQALCALSIFQHPGIPKVDNDGYLEFTHNHQKLHCIVMEKIEGENLKNWLQTHRNNQGISEKLAINWMRQLLDILNHIHPGYLHRDIKPDNIILKNNGQLVLIDFGAVKEITSRSQLPSHISSHTTIGTLGYTSPEQNDYSGEFNEQLPYQSDYFSLGCTFVHLLTGKPPHKFEAKNNKLIWRNQCSQKISHKFKNLIDWMMEYEYKKRPDNTQEISDYLYEIDLSKRKYWKGFISLWYVLISVILQIALLILLKTQLT